MVSRPARWVRDPYGPHTCDAFDPNVPFAPTFAIVWWWFCFTGVFFLYKFRPVLPCVVQTDNAVRNNGFAGFEGAGLRLNVDIQGQGSVYVEIQAAPAPAQGEEITHYYNIMIITSLIFFKMAPQFGEQP